MNKEKQLIKLLNAAMDLGSQAVTLADEYAGGESETAIDLIEQFQKLEVEIEEAINE